ncbi:MAG: glycosyl transferase family 1, partial [Candidatus Eremiobacteraeota bacterium]|nr:glycosyl transferase family 1 [Candidatus Eremiobacteraeota bacterium]
MLPTLEHLAVLSDSTGIIQHANESVPNLSTGYCTDDVSRAFMVVLARLRLMPRDEVAMQLASTYLSFLEYAQLEDGRFHNFMSYTREWLDDVGTQDSCGRALWSLGYGMRYAPTQAWRRLCRTLFERGLAAIDSFEFVHPRAYTLLGLSHAHAALRERRYVTALRFLGDSLLASYEGERSDDWPWFTPVMTYDNGRLPEALIRAGTALAEGGYLDAGLATLAFYERVTLDTGIFVPIGNRGWYARGETRAIYAQQPLEAFSLIDVELAAYDATNDPQHFA